MLSSRPVKQSDLNEVVDLLDRIFRHDHKVRDQTVLTDFPLFFAEGNLPNCRVIEQDGHIVSHAGIWPRTLVVDGATFKTGVIVLVATRADCRRRGFAAALMRDLQQQMRDEHYDLGILWTAVPNFYHRLGWELVEPSGWLLADACDAPALFEEPAAALDGTALRFQPNVHLDGVARLHDAEPVWFVRSRAEYAELLSLPKVNAWVLERAGKVAAYAVVGAAFNKAGVIEYAGSPGDILALLGYAGRKGDLPPSTPLVIFPHRDDLRKLLEPVNLQPLPSSKGQGVEMVYVVDPDRMASINRTFFVWGLDYA